MPLVCVGEFVLGYPRQNGSFGRRSSAPWKLGPEPFAPDTTAVAPYWAKNGSFLVYRRLRQNVTGFNLFLQAEAARLAKTPNYAGLTAEKPGAIAFKPGNSLRFELPVRSGDQRFTLVWDDGANFLACQAALG